MRAASFCPLVFHCSRLRDFQVKSSDGKRVRKNTFKHFFRQSSTCRKKQKLKSPSLVSLEQNRLRNRLTSWVQDVPIPILDEIILEFKTSLLAEREFLEAAFYQLAGILILHDRAR